MKAKLKLEVDFWNIGWMCIVLHVCRSFFIVPIVFLIGFRKPYFPELKESQIQSQAKKNQIALSKNMKLLGPRASCQMDK